MGGEGAGPLGSFIQVVRGVNGEALLHEELVVVSYPELGEPDAAIPTMKEVKFLLRFPSRN